MDLIECVILGASFEVAMQTGVLESGKKGLWCRPTGTRGDSMADPRAMFPAVDRSGDIYQHLLNM
jgi:hypothetical protein